MSAPNESVLRKKVHFHSSTSTNMTSLEGYVSRMKPMQSHIFFLCGENRSEIEKSPFHAPVLADGYEIIYIYGVVGEYGEYSIPSLLQFDGKPFQNIANGKFRLVSSNNANHELQATTKQFEPLMNSLNGITVGEIIADATVLERVLNSTVTLPGNFCEKFSK